jgi:hypothetical protein
MGGSMRNSTATTGGWTSFDRFIGIKRLTTGVGGGKLRPSIETG